MLVLRETKGKQSLKNSRLDKTGPHDIQSLDRGVGSSWFIKLIKIYPLVRVGTTFPEELNSVFKERRMELLQVYNKCKQQCRIPLFLPLFLHFIQQMHSFSRYLLSTYNQPVTILGTGHTVGKFFNFYFWRALFMP